MSFHTLLENAKNTLQELCQKNNFPMPKYSTSSEGPPHRPRWKSTVTLSLGDETLCTRTPLGHSTKTMAEKRCALLFIEGYWDDFPHKDQNIRKLVAPLFSHHSRQRYYDSASRGGTNRDSDGKDNSDDEDGDNDDNDNGLLSFDSSDSLDDFDGDKMIIRNSDDDNSDKNNSNSNDNNNHCHCHHSIVSRREAIHKLLSPFERERKSLSLYLVDLKSVPLLLHKKHCRGDDNIIARCSSNNSNSNAWSEGGFVPASNAIFIGLLSNVSDEIARYQCEGWTPCNTGFLSKMMEENQFCQKYIYPIEGDTAQHVQFALSYFMHPIVNLVKTMQMLHTGFELEQLHIITEDPSVWQIYKFFQQIFQQDNIEPMPRIVLSNCI